MIISTIFANLSWLGWLAAALFYVAIALFMSAVFAYFDGLNASGNSRNTHIGWSIGWPFALGVIAFHYAGDALAAIGDTIMRPVNKLRSWAWNIAMTKRETKKRNVRVGGDA